MMRTLKNLKRVLHSITSLNEDKSIFSKTSIDFLGYNISHSLLRPDAERLRPLRTTYSSEQNLSTPSAWIILLLFSGDTQVLSQSLTLDNC